jgi:hypothetical protein
MKRATTAAIVTAVSMAFAGPAWATSEQLTEAELDAVVAGSAGNFNGNKILSGNDVNVLNGNNTAVGVGIFGTGAIAVADGDKRQGKYDRGGKRYGKNGHGDKHYGNNEYDRGGKHYGKNDYGGDKHHGRGNFNGNKVLSGNDVNVLNGNNTAVGAGIFGTGAIAVRK